MHIHKRFYDYHGQENQNLSFQVNLSTIANKRIKQNTTTYSEHSKD